MKVYKLKEPEYLTPGENENVIPVQKCEGLNCGNGRKPIKV